MKICPHCGSENEDHILNCILCDYEFLNSEDGFVSPSQDEEDIFFVPATQDDAVQEQAAPAYDKDRVSYDIDEQLSENDQEMPSSILSKVASFFVEETDEADEVAGSSRSSWYILITVFAILIIIGCAALLLHLKKQRENQAILQSSSSMQNESMSSEDEEALENDVADTYDDMDFKSEKSLAEQVVEVVIENESMWLYSIDEGADGYTECWFQDLDMDGVPEFIVGGQVVGAHGGVFFDVYRYQDGKLAYMSVQSIENGTVWDTRLGIWGTGSRGGHNGFVCQLYQDTATDSYVYVYPSSDGAADYTDYSMYELSLASDNTLITEEIVTVEWTMDGYLYQPEYTYYETISTLTRKELLDRYDDYFTSLTPYRTSIKAIPCTRLSVDMSGHYDVMSDDEKKITLLESYEAWGYEKSAVIERPFSDLISEIRKIKDGVVPTNLYYIGNGTPYSDDGFLNLRSSPEITDNIIVEIPNDSIIEVYDCGKSDWYYVEYNSYKGYVKKDYVITEMDRQENTTEILTATVPLETRRTEPETEYKDPPIDPPATVPPTPIPTEPPFTEPEVPPPPLPEIYE